MLASSYAGFKYPDDFAPAVFSGRFVRNDYNLEKYLIPGSGDYVLPAVLLKPKQKMNGNLVLIVHSEGMDAALYQDSFVQDFVGTGHAVLLCDLPGIGSMGPGYLKGDSYIEGISYNQWFAAILAGKSNVGLRSEDLLRIVNFAKSNLADISRLSALSIGPVSSELLHAAILEPAISRIGLLRPIISYAELATTRFYNPEFIPFSVAGAINEYDLTDLIAGLHNRKIIILNPLSADGTEFEDIKRDNIMAFPVKVFTEKGVIDNLQLESSVTNQGTINQYLINWLK